MATTHDFGEFYAARKDAVFRVLLLATRNRAAAEDAVAEAFARAFARWPRVRQHPNPTAWVLRTALNVQRSWWRRLVREVPGQPPDRPTHGPTHELASELRGLVERLPRRQREVVGLRVLADLSAQETAAVLNISSATVHVHLHRALETLRHRLADDVASTLQPTEEEL